MLAAVGIDRNRQKNRYRQKWDHGGPLTGRGKGGAPDCGLVDEARACKWWRRRALISAGRGNFGGGPNPPRSTSKRVPSWLAHCASAFPATSSCAVPASFPAYHPPPSFAAASLTTTCRSVTAPLHGPDASPRIRQEPGWPAPRGSAARRRQENPANSQIIKPSHLRFRGFR